jgi:catechol 2,3-dioxygenase-like lactoylglutathione lyase family enzyme
MPETFITTAFIPVRDPQSAAAWYSRVLGLEIADAGSFSAVLTGGAGTSVTLMGPDSGIAATPGLAWATCNFRVDGLTAKHGELAGRGVPVGPIEGAEEVCLFFIATDPDGNKLLLTDR